MVYKLRNSWRASVAETGSIEPGVVDVPKRHALALSAFAKLAPEKKDEIYRLAAGMPVGSLPWEALRDAIAKELGPDFDAQNFVNAIRGIFYARHAAAGRTEDDLINIVVAGVEDTIDAQHIADRTTLRSVVVNLLTLKNLELSHNVARVKFDHAFHLHDAGIITDLRPIFDRDGSKVEGFIVSHTLRINYAGAGDEDQELYLAVDTYDLDKLEAVIKRARRKQIALKSLTDNSKLNLIEN